MKRLLLVSMFEKISHRLQEIELEFHNKTVTYIPTASLVEDTGDWISLEKMHLQRMGLAVDELDISSLVMRRSNRLYKKRPDLYSGWKYLLSPAGIEAYGRGSIDCRGGQPGKALYWRIRGGDCDRTGYWIFSSNGRPGKSAKTEGGLRTASDRFFVLPHAGNPAFQEAVEEILRNYASSLDLK